VRVIVCSICAGGAGDSLDDFVLLVLLCLFHLGELSLSCRLRSTTLGANLYAYCLDAWIAMRLFFWLALFVETSLALLQRPLQLSREQSLVFVAL